MRGDPQVGRYYMVPCVRGVWIGKLGDWPVIGTLHRDAKFFDFDIDHYHIDLRFLRKREWPGHGYRRHRHTNVAGRPLSITPSCNADGLPPPRLIKRRCAVARFEMAEFRELTSKGQVALAAAFPEAIKGKHGWICPHQNFDMRNVTPVDGAITCPMHGLRFCARTGKCLDLEGKQ